MTLVLFAINRRQAVQISDRRLVSNGAAVDDEYAKGIVLLVPDARLLVSFTGLARAGRFETRKWIFDTLAGFGSDYSNIRTVVETFTDKLNQSFGSLPGLSRVAEHLRILEVGFVGYSYPVDRPMAIWAKITNRSVDGQIGRFKALYGGETDPDAPVVTGALGLGCTNATSRSDFLQLREALSADLPTRALRSIMTRIITRAADTPAANGLIGKQLDYIHLPADSNDACTSGAESMVAKHRLEMPPTVYIGSGGSIAMERLSLWREPTGTPITVPRVRRNQPCPCGSGQRYRNCHGAFI